MRLGGDPLPGFFVSVASKGVAGGLGVSADCKGDGRKEVDSRQFKVERQRKRAKHRDAPTGSM